MKEIKLLFYCLWAAHKSMSIFCYMLLYGPLPQWYWFAVLFIPYGLLFYNIVVVLKRRSVSSLISCSTTIALASLRSKVRRFLSFHTFRNVYISTAVFVLLCSFDCSFDRYCKVVIHQSSMVMSNSGLRTRS